MYNIMNTLLHATDELNFVEGKLIFMQSYNWRIIIDERHRSVKLPEKVISDCKSHTPVWFLFPRRLQIQSFSFEWIFKSNIITGNFIYNINKFNANWRNSNIYCLIIRGQIIYGTLIIMTYAHTNYTLLYNLHRVLQCKFSMIT